MTLTLYVCVSSAVHDRYLFDLEKRIFPLMILRVCCNIDLNHLVGPLTPTEHVHVTTRPKQSFTFFCPTIYNSTSLKVHLEVKLWRRTIICGSLNDRAGPIRRMSVELFGKGDSKNVAAHNVVQGKKFKAFWFAFCCMFDFRSCTTVLISGHVCWHTGRLFVSPLCRISRLLVCHLSLSHFGGWCWLCIAFRSF